jgi:hypothetical protein
VVKSERKPPQSPLMNYESDGDDDDDDGFQTIMGD